MQDFAVWQWGIIGMATVVFVGGMKLVVLRLLTRRSKFRANARPGTAAESMLYGALVPEGSRAFDGFSYRVGARFAGRCRVVVGPEHLVFCGPRGPRGLYSIWIFGQAVLMAAAPVAIVWAAVAPDWRALLWALALMTASVLVMAVGAGVWPGLGETPGLGDGHMPALEISKAHIHGLKLGAGWADGGLSLVVLPYLGPINQLAEGHAVSWWAPDDSGHEVRFAFHCYETEQAQALYDAIFSAKG